MKTPVKKKNEDTCRKVAFFLLLLTHMNALLSSVSKMGFKFLNIF